MGVIERLHRNGEEPFDFTKGSSRKFPLEFMIKKILKWAAFSLVGFVVLVIVLASFAPEKQPAPVVEENSQSVEAEAATSTSNVASVPAPSPSASFVNEVTPAPVKTKAPTETQYTYYSVTKVVDGDTLTISLDGKLETIRLIGINTPETVDPRKPVECFGKEASNKAKQLLMGKRVRIEKEISQGERDKYGRLLAYAYIENGTFFNKYMIEEGYAYEYTYDKPYKYQTEFKQAQKNAQEAKRGLWNPSACSTTATTPPPVVPTQPTGHTFYLSTYYSAKFYYCDTDDGWKALSTSYLKSFTSEQALLAAYPSRKLHEECK